LGKNPFIETKIDASHYDSTNVESITSLFIDIVDSNHINSFITSLFHESYVLDTHELKHTITSIGKNTLLYVFLLPQASIFECNNLLGSLLPNVNSKEFIITVSIYVNKNNMVLTSPKSIKYLRDSLLLSSTSKSNG